MDLTSSQDRCLTTAAEVSLSTDDEVSTEGMMSSLLVEGIGANYGHNMTQTYNTIKAALINIFILAADQVTV